MSNEQNLRDFFVNFSPMCLLSIKETFQSFKQIRQSIAGQDIGMLKTLFFSFHNHRGVG